jgi:hypothetical protein
MTGTRDPSRPPTLLPSRLALSVPESHRLPPAASQGLRTITAGRDNVPPSKNGLFVCIMVYSGKALRVKGACLRAHRGA